MVDSIKISVPVFYTRNKSMSYREGVVKMSSSLLGFLYREGLIVRCPFDADGDLDMSYELRKSELNSMGKELFKSAVPNWWRKIDTGLDSSNIDYLSKELNKIKSKS